MFTGRSSSRVGFEVRCRFLPLEFYVSDYEVGQRYRTSRFGGCSNPFFRSPWAVFVSPFVFSIFMAFSFPKMGSLPNHLFQYQPLTHTFPGVCDTFFHLMFFFSPVVFQSISKNPCSCQFFLFSVVILPPWSAPKHFVAPHSSFSLVQIIFHKS